MDIKNFSRKDTGNFGEGMAAIYLTRHGFRVTARNVSRKTGELDIIAVKGKTLHVIEIKTSLCEEFPNHEQRNGDVLYSPANNLHANKIRKVARTAEWCVSNIDWEGDLQIDGALVWIRREDGRALVRYIPQIL